MSVRRATAAVSTETVEQPATTALLPFVKVPSESAMQHPVLEAFLLMARAETFRKEQIMATSVRRVTAAASMVIAGPPWTIVELPEAVRLPLVTALANLVSC